MNAWFDKGFEIIATGMEMIETVIEAHKELHGDGEAEPKSEHPSAFSQSLQENEEGAK